MTDFLSLPDAIAAHVSDGCTVALEGFTHLIPFAAGHEIIRQGNVLIEGIVGVQKEVVLAARRAIVTVEEVVDDLRPPSVNSVVLPYWTIAAIAEVPRGARPSYAHGYYTRDNAFYLAWDAISRDRDGFRRWMDAHVLDRSARPEAVA